MDLEEQIKAYKELGAKIEALEKEKKALGAEILPQIKDNSVQIAGYTVRRHHRLSIKLTLDEARPFGATKTTEVVDKDKVKDLYEQGHPIPGVTELNFISVHNTKKEPVAAPSPSSPPFDLLSIFSTDE